MPRLARSLLILTFIFLQAAMAQEKPDQTQGFSAKQLVDNYEDLLGTRYSLFTHYRTYVLPVSYNWVPHQDVYANVPGVGNKESRYYDNTEAEFQISFFIPVYRKVLKTQWDFLVAYTHQSWWQVYNTAWSRPFRETNYTPEVFFRRLAVEPKSFLNLDMFSFDVGYVHQSNGQVQYISHSWDRIFGRMYFTSGDVFLNLMAWIKIPEKKSEDDNPDIQRYTGIGDIRLQKAFGLHTIEAKVPIAEKPGIEIQYSYPWHDQLRFFVSGRYGYGQSLIEYNRVTEQLGIGFALENFADKKSKQLE